MANKASKPMPAEFRKWHAALSFGEDEARLQTRWATASALAADVSSVNIEALVRLTFKTRQTPTSAAFDKILETFSETLDNFQAKDRDREIQVIAAAALATMMSGGQGAGEAAIAVTTALLSKGRKLQLPVDLAALSETTLARLAQSSRVRPRLEVAPWDMSKFGFDKAIAKVRENNLEGAIAGFGLGIEATQSALNAIAKRQIAVLDQVETFIQIQDEELQMLWWLVGQRSYEFKCAFDEVPATSRILVFAKELADQTVCLPGPMSVEGLLSRAGVSDKKKLSIPTAVNGTQADWLGGLLPEGEPSPVTMPVHYAIKRKIETGDDASWIAGWAAAVGVPATFSLSPSALSMQFYRERLLHGFADKEPS